MQANFKSPKRTNSDTSLPALMAALILVLTSASGSAVASAESSSPILSSNFKTAFRNEADKASVKEIESVLKDLESKWNNHELEAVMEFYDDLYVNNDGLDKKAVQELTRDFWKTYPDARSVSETKKIRVEGKYATVESTDKAEGTTAQEPQGISGKGYLSSLSEGQLYLKKFGSKWKIVGDRIDFEKVNLSFGTAKEIEALFEAPQQVKSGREYSARVYVDVPSGSIAFGSITSEPLKYPQSQHKDIWRELDNQGLERIIMANKSNYNELLMATIGITDASRKNLRGLAYLTRRLNVVPAQIIDDSASIAKSSESNESLTTNPKPKANSNTREEEKDKKQSPANDNQNKRGKQNEKSTTNGERKKENK